MTYTVTATATESGNILASFDKPSLAAALSTKSELFKTYHKSGVPPGSVPAFLDDDDIAPPVKKTPIVVTIS